MGSEVAKSENESKLNFGQALAVVVFMFAVMIYGIVKNVNVRALFVFIITFTIFIGLWAGYTWKEMFTAMVEKVKSVANTFYILLGIGFLISTWMYSGTAPSLIYYLLHMVSPKVIVFCAFLICTIVGLAIGTSYGTCGTVGVVMMGAGTVLGINPALMAGAVISGINVGQTLSPLCDVVCLAGNYVGVEPMTLVKRNLYITVPLTLICAVFYLLIGFSQGTGGAVDNQAIFDSIKSVFNVTPLTLIPFVALLIGCIRQLSTPACLFGSGIIAIFTGMLTQGFDLAYGIECAYSGFKLSGIGVDKTSVLPEIVTLVERGGMKSNEGSLSLVCCALTFAGLVGYIGALRIVIDKIFSFAKSRVAVVTSQVVTSWICGVSSCNTYFTVLTPMDLFRDKAEKAGLSQLDQACISNHIGCIFLSLVPWAGCGVYYSGCVGVDPFAYAPYALFCWGGSILAIITVMLGIGYQKKPGTVRGVQAVS